MPFIAGSKFGKVSKALGQRKSPKVPAKSVSPVAKAFGTRKPHTVGSAGPIARAPRMRGKRRLA